MQTHVLLLQLNEFDFHTRAFVLSQVLVCRIYTLYIAMETLRPHVNLKQCYVMVMYVSLVDGYVCTVNVLWSGCTTCYNTCI